MSYLLRSAGIGIASVMDSVLVDLRGTMWNSRCVSSCAPPVAFLVYTCVICSCMVLHQLLIRAGRAVAVG
jgi:hypothetical protein